MLFLASTVTLSLTSIYLTLYELTPHIIPTSGGPPNSLFYQMDDRVKHDDDIDEAKAGKGK